MGGGAADTVFEADNNVAIGYESLKSILSERLVRLKIASIRANKIVSSKGLVI